jgi:hypothetical protein
MPLTSRRMVDMAVSVRQALDRPMPSADAATARLAAARAAGMASELRRLQSVLSGSMGRDAGWSGLAELAFQDSLATELSQLAPAVQRYEGYAAALAGYARDLESVGPALSAARSRLGVGADPALAADFERRWHEWDLARRRCAAVLAVAGSFDADRHRHGWSRLVAEVTHVVGLDDLSRTLGDLSQALVVAGVVMSLVCPPAAAAIWAAVAVVTVCQLAVDLTRRERGEQVGLSTLGLDALGAIPGGRLVAGVHTVAEFRSVAEADAAIQRLAPELRQSRLVPGGGLAAHEGSATYRGHTLLKHVGKTPKELADRFKTDPGLQRSSSFTDRRTAEAVSAKMLDDHQQDIARWLASPRSTLKLRSSFGKEIGKSVAVGGTIVSASGSFMVLRKESSVLGYYIRTVFPTP